MKVEHESGAQFYIAQAEENAVLDYRLEGDCLNLLRVFVPPALRGQGVAEVLTREALEYAKSKGYQVIPTCPYISKTFLARHPEYQTLLRES